MPDPTTDKADPVETHVPADIAARPQAADSSTDHGTRTRLAVAAVGCLLVGGVVYLSGQWQALASAFIRVGLLAATTWYAFPTLSRIRWRPKNSFETTAVYTLGVLIVIRPRIFLPIGLALGLLMLFKIPGSKKNT